MEVREDDPQLKDRVQRLMQFLQELVKARTKPVRNLRLHDDIIWLNESRLSVSVDFEVTAGEVVIRSRRVALEEPPEVPRNLREWIQGDPTDSRASLAISPNATAVEGEFTRWLSEWRMWAQLDQERRPNWELYQALQHALQEMVSRPESVELVLASGLLELSAKVAGEDIRTHIVTQPVTVERDETTGDLLVRLNADTAPRLEDTQLLTGLDAFDVSGSRALQERLHESASPVDANILVFLKEWAARALTTNVEVEESGTDSPSGRVLTPSPALVLRKRGAFALVEYYETMIAAAERDDSTVPLGLAQLVTAIEPDGRVAWLERTGSAPSAALAEDPLFPLPANREQSEIIERLADDSGVVVEGPPGTGKTHTIANLVSALLANGQRVLVTSEKSQALRVLRDKLPEEMQELCVSITDIGRGGSDELNKSVAEIATRKASFSKGDADSRIADLTGRRRQALSRRAKITEDIRSLRESETFQHPEIAPGYSGTAAAIVREVTNRAELFDWLPGPVNADAPPLTGEQFRTLITLTLRSNPTRAGRLDQSLPTVDHLLPSMPELQQLCTRASIRPADINPGAAHFLQLLGGATAPTLMDVQRRCERLQARVAEVRALEPAFQNAAEGVLSGHTSHLWSRTAEVPALLDMAKRSDAFVGSRRVETQVAGRRALNAYGALAVAMEKGVEWRTRFRKSDEQKAVEELGVLATVDGEDAVTADSARIVTEHLRALDCVQSAATLVGDIGIVVHVNGSRTVQINELHRTAVQIGHINGLAAEANGLVEVLLGITPAAPRIRSVSEAQALAAAAGAVAATHDADDARSRMSQLSAEVSAVSGGAPAPEYIDLIEGLGSADFDEITRALSDLATARQQQEEERYLNTLRGQIEGGAPGLATLIADTAGDDRWSTRLDNLDQAWAWRRAHTWMQREHEVGRDKQQELDLATAEADIAQLTARLAAERAWVGCLQRMTATEVQALQAYRGHVSSIGKGTGKYAETYRASAREAMQIAQRAVPAWVMPLQQVLASIPPEPNTFDVVIVDEASQADISNLFLLWLAPRVIVVGDDKQCAPSEVSSGALDGIFDRLDMYLHDVPGYLRNSFTPRDSLFSLLRTRFGQVIRLREHFRCMPEIINWSSNQFYRDAPLVPVRQFGADRLPPLRTTYVEGGVVTGRNATLANRPEALAIVDAIVACLSDEAYDGKTFGVVVLQGQSQVDVIQNELLTRLDIDVWDERRLRIGTPPDFQGDERHVILLSMVVAPEQQISAMTKNDYQRRYNVAASRAQDQLWLFHSRTADSLRSTDLRHSLLTYMQSTSPAPADPMPGGVTRDERHRDFDSLFEQRIYLDIVARGYHVNPQVEVNSRRIDLVVTGAAGRLAVECDGDAFHTSPEQVRADMERERELKRCGWEFWRIRESEYYLDPVGSLSGLWAELDKRGISPGSVSTAETVSTSTWAPPLLPDDESLAEDVAEAELANVLPSEAPLTTPVAEPTVDVDPIERVPPAESGVIPPERPDTEPPAPPVVAEVNASAPEVIQEPLSAVPASAWEVMPESAIPRPDDYLFDRLLEAAKSGPVSTAELTELWRLDRVQIWSALRKLAHKNLMDKVGDKPDIRYALAEPPNAEGDAPAAATHARPEPGHQEFSPRLLRTLIVAEVKKGPATRTDLHRRLPADEGLMRETLDALVSDETLAIDQGKYVLSEDHITPATVGSGLPSAKRDSAKSVLTAAAWTSPVTMERGSRITRLPEGELSALLAELAQEGLLRKRAGADGPEWIRP
ncbi:MULTISPECIES: AAA domain-containing protein [unclassified Rhodococcus (in: high G+C Gram-positive bacteria)]|uniref:AAA domain-containing protein n=1 Tax=unclassified Rhodococcus (in: high G+C Gram-positive bacteria) TaxID=192944 RepID=UPI0028A26F44|nr:MULTISPECIES: AAA domain-containing protein [unclassified Rhodococcus (in: high G+C Gram-positive bacteria)]